MTKDEVMKLALDALEELNNTNSHWWQEVDEDVVVQLSNAETALREALAEQPAQQEPLAKKNHEPKIDLGKYAGTYGGYTTPEPSEGYLQKAYRLANELRSHLSIAPAQRTWVGLTDDEIKEIHHLSFDLGLFETAELAHQAYKENK